MATARFTRRAEEDLAGIGLYTLRTWGRKQCDEIRPGLRRAKVGSHVVFYREETGGILVSRILHERMLPEGQRMEDEGASGQRNVR